jgi:hypothetical protein
MTYLQKRALKRQVRNNVKYYKKQIKQWAKMGSTLHLRTDRIFKVGFNNIRKELRLFVRLNNKIR